MENIGEDYLISLFQEGKTYEDISIILQNNNPGARGFSVRSIKRYCRRCGISPRVSQPAVEDLVRNAVREVWTDVIRVIFNHILTLVITKTFFR